MSEIGIFLNVSVINTVKNGPFWILVIKSDRYTNTIYPAMWLWPVLTFTWPTYICDKKVNDNVWAIITTKN
jgi:hypothetical protein